MKTPEERPPRTISELGEEVYRVQDASNLCGVVQSFARAVLDLQKFAFSDKTIKIDGQDMTEAKAREHIIRAWVDKIADLSQYQAADNLGDLRVARLLMESGK